MNVMQADHKEQFTRYSLQFHANTRIYSMQSFPKCHMLYCVHVILCASSLLAYIMNTYKRLFPITYRILDQKTDRNEHCKICLIAIILRYLNYLLIEDYR